MGNMQITTIGAGEVQNPRVYVPRAMRRIFYRLALFYVMSILVVGLILPSDDPNLGGGGTANSPFVLAFKNAGVKAVPGIINVVVITSAFSSGNGVLFLASRVLLGLAADGHAPKVLLRTNQYGTPWVAVLVSFVLAPLGKKWIPKSILLGVGRFVADMCVCVCCSLSQLRIVGSRHSVLMVYQPHRHGWLDYQVRISAILVLPCPVQEN
jgi:L-asparagine transporter-like permease